MTATPRRVAVIRNCCTIGNCDKCSGVTPFGKCLTVTQTPEGGVLPERAKLYEHNWQAYGARIVGVTAAKRAQSITDELVKARRAEMDRINERFMALNAAK